MGDTDSTKRRTVNMASTRQDVINALISESAKGADFPDSKRDFFKSRLTRDDLVYVLKQIKPEASVTQKDNKTALLDLIIENGALKTSSSSSPSESSSPSGSSSPSELSSHSDAPAPKPVSEPMEPVPELASEPIEPVSELASEPMEPVPEVDELASEPMEVDEVELGDNAGLQGLAQVATDPEERSIVETCPASGVPARPVLLIPIDDEAAAKAEAEAAVKKLIGNIKRTLASNEKVEAMGVQGLDAHIVQSLSGFVGEHTPIKPNNKSQQISDKTVQFNARLSDLRRFLTEVGSVNVDTDGSSQLVFPGIKDLRRLARTEGQGNNMAFEKKGDGVDRFQLLLFTSALGEVTEEEIGEFLKFTLPDSRYIEHGQKCTASGTIITTISVHVPNGTDLSFMPELVKATGTTRPTGTTMFNTELVCGHFKGKFTAPGATNGSKGRFQLEKYTRTDGASNQEAISTVHELFDLIRQDVLEHKDGVSEHTRKLLKEAAELYFRTRTVF